MKNRIDMTFEALRHKNEKALIIYFTAGDPDIRTTRQLMDALVNAGADMIELGVPFSDPMGDGAANQRAAERALKKKISLKDIFACVRSFRKTNTTTPVILFSYLNPAFSFGYGRFASECRKSGVDGCLFVDMPYDEEPVLKKELKKNSIYSIYLAAPTTERKRLKNIASCTKGFLYLVSSLGVTGARKKFDKGFSTYVRSVRKISPVPVCVGFGISTPEMARQACRHAEGVIIGSAIVSIIEKNNKDKEKLVPSAGAFVRSVKKALMN